MTASGFSPIDPPDPEAIIQCIRCGMCLPHCPTYAVLGIEQDSPRGRIALIKAVSDGRLEVTDPDFHLHMYRCLDCRACETACPAGVRFGYLMETARGQIEQARAGVAPVDLASPRRVDGAAGRSVKESLTRALVLDGLFREPGRLNVAGGLLRLYQHSGVQTLVRRLGILKLIGMAEQEALLPPLSSRFYRPTGEERRTYRAVDPAAPRVALFAGCVQRLMFADVNRATERVLLRNGCALVAPTDQTCCGAIHAHTGQREDAKDMARRNIDAFDLEDIDAIIINAAGCGAMLKEYAELLHDDPVYADKARAFVAKVKDIHEYLAELPLDPPHSPPRPVRVTYQDACHLAHAQRIKLAPREVLKAIPGVELVEMAQADWCCGSAGIYNVTQPELSAAILDGKMNNVEQTQAEVLAAPNPGCLLQLQAGIRQRGLAMRVAHPIQLLDEAYQAEERASVSP